MISPTFKELSLVSNLKTRILQGRLLGKSACRILESAIKELTEMSLLLVNLTDADVLDYYFCEEAVGPLVKAFKEGRYTKKNVIFKVEGIEFEDLLEGIIRHVTGKTPVEETKQAFEKEGLAIKLFNKDSEKVEFIGSATIEQRKILDFINEKGRATANEIAGAMGVAVEGVVEDLNILKTRYFIFAEEPASSGERDHMYWSFYEFLKERGHESEK